MVACSTCNVKKSDKLLEQTKMKRSNREHHLILLPLILQNLTLKNGGSILTGKMNYLKLDHEFTIKQYSRGNLQREYGIDSPLGFLGG